MMTSGFFLRLSLSALLIVATCGIPLKGSKSTQQSSGDISDAAANFVSNQGVASSHYKPLSYGASREVSMPALVQDPSPQLFFVQVDPSLSSLSSGMPDVGFSGGVVPVQPVYASSGGVVPVQPVYASSGGVVPVQPAYASSGGVVPVQPAYASSGGVVPVQPAYASSGGVVPVQPAYASSGGVVPVQPAYARSTQSGAAQPGLPETKWTIEPSFFPEDALADSQAMGPIDFLPPAPQPPSGPVLQSGETSNVVKEAELGNYQHQMEEFGYPSEPLLSGQGFTNAVIPASGLGGYWSYPYPNFDYRLLYGMYPPGTYSTFSQHHEKGKDFYQDLHYLREHADDSQGSVQQKKVFHGAA